MTVRRDGYWDGTYARAGDSITVEDETLVETLEVAGFAVRQDRKTPTRKEPAHGSR